MRSFFELHIQLEDFFQQIRRNNLLLHFARCARLLGRVLRLLFQFHAFQAQQVLGPLDRVFQRAIRVIQLRTLFQAPFLLLLGPRRNKDRDEVSGSAGRTLVPEPATSTFNFRGNPKNVK